jgi:spoIIIJ-associated protein
MRSVETEGTSIDEAIARALELLHIERDRVDVDILENSSRGILGFGGKPARIRATVRNPLLGAPSATVEPVSQETTPTSPSDDAAVEASIATAKAAFQEILRHLGVESQIDVRRSDDGWRFGITGEGAGIVIGRHGQTLDAIEHLVNRIASHRSGVLSKIAVDTEGYRERRQEALEETARRAADKARHTGRPVTLNPMSARDRRIIHVALTDEHGVMTRSQGEGSYRRVVVVPAGASGRPRS